MLAREVVVRGVLLSTLVSTRDSILGWVIGGEAEDAEAFLPAAVAEDGETSLDSLDMVGTATIMVLTTGTRAVAAVLKEGVAAVVGSMGVWRVSRPRRRPTTWWLPGLHLW